MRLWCSYCWIYSQLTKQGYRKTNTNLEVANKKITSVETAITVIDVKLGNIEKQLS